ncbi:MAG: HAMP domain-containing protein, partial [Desulfobacteraceae bacterium]
MVLRNRGIAFKLIFFFTLCGGLIFLLVFGFNYRFSRALIRANTAEQARTLALSKVNRIDATLLSIQKIPESMAHFLENGSYDQAELTWVLRALVQNNPEIYGAAVAFEPYGFDDRMLYFAPYFYKSNGQIAFVDLGRESYQYLQADWYQIPKALNRPDWSEPYYDEGGGNILMTTYSVPFYKKDGDKKRLIGIVTADVNLTSLQEVVSSIKVLRSGYGFLISKNGTIVTHPIKELIMNETLFGVAEERNDPGLRAIARKMIRGESGFVPFQSLATQQPGWIHYTPVPAGGWSLAVFFPQEELFADIARLNRIVIVLGLAGLFLLALAVAVIARSITRPLRAMAQATRQIALGNLDIDLPPQKSEDEVGRLSAAFFFMRESLKEYIRQLTAATASRERMQSELQIAHDIQMSILPSVFPP